MPNLVPAWRVLKDPVLSVPPEVRRSSEMMVQRLEQSSSLRERESGRVLALALEAVGAVVTRSHWKMTYSLVPGTLIWVAPSVFVRMGVRTADARCLSRDPDTHDQQWGDSRPGCTAFPHPRIASSSLPTGSRCSVLVAALNQVLPRRVPSVHERHAASGKVKCIDRMDSLLVGCEMTCAARQREMVRKSGWTLKVVGRCY